jgi:hypothetical protein
MKNGRPYFDKLGLAIQTGRRPVRIIMKMGRSDLDKLELAHFLKNP